jgi:hypothetical protein
MIIDDLKGYWSFNHRAPNFIPAATKGVYHKNKTAQSRRTEPSVLISGAGFHEINVE